LYKCWCAGDYLLYDMEDATSKTHDAKFMVEKIYEIIDEIKEKYGIVVIAVVLDGAEECHKARRLIAADVDCKHLILIWCNAHLFNLHFGDLFHRTKSKGSCYEICTILCDGIKLFNNHWVLLSFWSWSKEQLMAKKVLFVHLVQLDGTLYVMLQNVFKNPISQLEVWFWQKEIYWNRSLKHSGTRRK